MDVRQMTETGQLTADELDSVTGGFRAWLEIPVLGLAAIVALGVLQFVRHGWRVMARNFGRRDWRLLLGDAITADPPINASHVPTGEDVQ